MEKQESSSLPEDFPGKDLETLLSRCSTTDKERNGSPKSFANILRHIRNAIAHKRLEAYPCCQQEIEGFIFRDSNDKSHETFELK